MVVGARQWQPAGGRRVADGEYFLASDVAPIVEHTRQVVYLDDGEMAVLTPDGFHTATIAHDPVDKAVHEVEWDLAQHREGRLRALHAQGDLRAAGVGAERDARPPATRIGRPARLERSQA
mgnify:CR=1 FL=1